MLLLGQPSTPFEGFALPVYIKFMLPDDTERCEDDGVTKELLIYTQPPCTVVNFANIREFGSENDDHSSVDVYHKNIVHLVHGHTSCQPHFLPYEEKNTVEKRGSPWGKVHFDQYYCLVTFLDHSKLLCIIVTLLAYRIVECPNLKQFLYFNTFVSYIGMFLETCTSLQSGVLLYMTRY